MHVEGQQPDCKVPEELLIEVSKPQKPLHLLPGGGNRPLSNSTNLTVLHLDVFSGDNKIQKGDSRNMEHAPLRFEEQLVVEEALYDLGNKLDVDVFIPGEDGVI